MSNHNIINNLKDIKLLIDNKEYEKVTIFFNNTNYNDINNKIKMDLYHLKLDI